ncbi:RloB family protein [Thalassospira sp.]|uniref:RloB family protein n=1 Tax=Thalassospira sp. TaxID=1912094 RepID=UPI002732E729|nr:RloB family protein [Thalassospira sp.]MDP2697569.1 RloB family protein [Thalassospira sp.]
MGRRIPDLKRRGSVRAPKKTFYLFCEGKNTEPDYFRALKRKLRDRLISVEPVPAAGVPFTIARKSADMANAIGKGAKRKKAKQSYQEADEVWAIFDRDAHPHIEEAKQLCQSNNVGVAFSDPCFELWLILHIQDFDGGCDRHQIQRALRGVLGGYDPNEGKTADFTVLLDEIETAEKRAEVLLERRTQEGDDTNPSTTVFKLTRKIRGVDT